MKSILIMLSIVGLLIGLASCGKSETPAATAAATTIEASEYPTTTNLSF